MKRESPQAKAAFEHWYGSDRSCRKTAKSVGVSERHVERWAVDWGWHAKADNRDREAAKRAERDAIARRARVLNEQRMAGELLRRRGTQYYTANDVLDGREAIAAISKGIELERQAEQLPAYIFEVLRMDEDELHAEQQRLVREQAALTAGDADTGAAPGREAAGPEAAAVGDPVLPADADRATA